MSRADSDKIGDNEFMKHLWKVLQNLTPLKQVSDGHMVVLSTMVGYISHHHPNIMHNV